MDTDCPKAGGSSYAAAFLFSWLALVHGRDVLDDLVGGFGYGGGAGGHGLGVDGVAVGDVEVDEAAGGRVLGRQGVGQHQGSALPPWGMGIRTRV